MKASRGRKIERLRLGDRATVTASDESGSAIPICYLCGEPIDEADLTEDHVLPRQFIKRSQPRAKGFAYAGKRPAHASCNNRFGPERYCQAALALLEVFRMQDEEPPRFTRRDKPSHSFIALTPDQLPGFGPAELDFFGIIDVRHRPVEDLKEDAFFADKAKVNVIKKAHNVIFSVLAKTAAAFLLSKPAIAMPKHWRILMVPFIDRSGEFDLQSLFGFLQPYEEGLHIWAGPAENGDGAVALRHGNLVVFILVAMSRDRTFWNRVSELVPTGTRYMFNGQQLTELVDYDWSRRAF